MIKKKIKLLLWACLFVSFTLSAQTENIELNLQLSFSDAVKRSVKTSLELENLKSNLKIEKVRSAKNWFSLSPNLSLVSSLTYFGQPLYQLDAAGKQVLDESGNSVLVRPSFDISLGFKLVQPITAAVETVAKAQALNASFKSSLYEVHAEDNAVRFKTAKSYRDVQKSERLYHIANERLRLIEKQKQEVQVLIKHGRVPENDLLRVEVSESKARLEIAKANARWENVRAKFLVSLNFKASMDCRFDPIDFSLDKEVVLSVDDLENYHEQALKNRVDLKAEYYKSEALKRQQTLPLYNLLPQLSAALQFEHHFAKTSILMPRSTMSVGLLLNWDLWNGGRDFFDFRENQLSFRKSRNRYVIHKREAALEILKSRNDLIAGLEAFRLRKTMLVQSKEIYRGVMERYRLGVVPVLELLEAEEELNKAHVAYVASMIELDGKNFELQEVVGDKTPKSII